MIQDIKPSIFYNEFNDRSINEKSRIFIFKENEVLIKHKAEGSREISLPTYDDKIFNREELIYLFRIDDISYFLSWEAYNLESRGFSFESYLIFRNSRPRAEAFAGFNAYHLYCWYRDNKFCGRCGRKFEFSQNERALKCNKCGYTLYPKICPAVIVGVLNENKILMTKYAHGYKKYALVAGYNEIGESIERTVEREVMEEVGMRVKSLTYYKSQPWGISSSLLMGFYCEVDGDTEIKLDKKELKEGKWFDREDIVVEENDISLTREMISRFKALGLSGCIEKG